MINPKGQSLVELASFWTILLFCLAILIQYGMQANYQQNLQMQAFRKATKAAYYKSGPGANISLAMTKDKGIPDPRDPWGFAERHLMGANASLTWDSNVQAFYIDDYGETPLESDLPRSIIEINDTLGLREEDLRDGAIDNLGQAQGAFKTAKYGVPRGCSGSITVVLESSPSRRESLHEEYREVDIDCNEIRVLNRAITEEAPGREYAYIKIDGLKHRVTSADIDGDGEMETIIAVRGTDPSCPEGYCGRVGSFKYVDYQEGDINSEYMVVSPWDVGKGGIDAQQGLITDYTLTKTDNNRLVKTENASEISTTTSLNTKQSTAHTIRLNNGSTKYTTTFRPAESGFTWRVHK